MNEEKFKRIMRILRNSDTHPLDDDFIKDYIQSLEKENQNLKKQYCERTDCSGRIGNSKKVEKLLNSYKELKKWLEEMLDDENDIFSVVRVKDVLSKLNELEEEN